MNRQVVLEIGNTHIKAGFIEVSSLPQKILSSWGKRDSASKFFGAEEELPAVFDEELHWRAIKGNEIYNLDFLIELIENTLNSLNVPLELVQLTLLLPSNLIAVQLPLRAKLIKLIYERLRVAAVFLAEVACMAAAGSNHGTGLVISFDGEGAEVSAVNDFMLVTPATEYFQSRDLSPAIVNVIESVLNRVEPDRRGITLNHIILNGNPLPLSNSSLIERLSNLLKSCSILAVSDYPADTQPATFAFKSIPEFYFEIGEEGREHVAWFGATITGKYAHSDSKTFIPPKQ